MCKGLNGLWQTLRRLHLSPKHFENQKGQNQGLDSAATIKNISSSVMEDES